jgi:site-specific DNA recombinase
MYSKHRLACSGSRDRGICSNRLTIRRDELEVRLLTAIEHRFLGDEERFRVFCEEFTAATNEARSTLRANAAAATRERNRIDGEIAKLIQAIKDGVSGAVVKDELARLETLREQVLAESTSLRPAGPLLHPNMAAVYRDQITKMREAVMRNEETPEAREAVRGLVEAVIVRPLDGQLEVEVRGSLAGMLGFVGAPSQTAEMVRQVLMVAGARNQRYLQLWSGAA